MADEDFKAEEDGDFNVFMATACTTRTGSVKKGKGKKNPPGPKPVSRFVRRKAAKDAKRSGAVNVYKTPLGALGEAGTAEEARAVRFPRSATWQDLLAWAKPGGWRVAFLLDEGPDALFRNASLKEGMTIYRALGSDLHAWASSRKWRQSLLRRWEASVMAEEVARSKTKKAPAAAEEEEDMDAFDALF